MRKQEIDYILARIIDSDKDISDLNFTVGKLPQVEISGELKAVGMEFLLLSLLLFKPRYSR